MVDVEKTTLDTSRNPNLDETYRNIIKPAILKAGCKSIRAGEGRVPVWRGSLMETTSFKYRAFLSYSHRDTAWGRGLHAALEGYAIDNDLIGRETPAGPIPKTLRPIFRDREDFAAGASLSEQTLAALEASLSSALPMRRRANM